MSNSGYVKPAVVESGHSPEPVESGCCLTSCGGASGWDAIRQDWEQRRRRGSRGSQGGDERGRKGRVALHLRHNEKR